MEYPKINYKYWREAYEKTINGSKPNERVQKSLNGIKTTILKEYPENSNNKLALLLKRDKLEDRNMSKIKMLADEIADEIDHELDTDVFNYHYLTIFDAINAWGGISAKGMYNFSVEKYQNSTTRKGWNFWIKKYIEATKQIKKGNTVEVLKNLHKVTPSAQKSGIENLGIAFASKHMWYWSDYFMSVWEKGESKEYQKLQLTERYIVFDMRISKLLFYKSPERISYNEALERFKSIKSDLNKKLQNKQIAKFDNSDIEKSLFAFSQYYFANDIDVWGDCDYQTYPDHYTKEEYIEITKNRIQTCKDQKQKLSSGVDFEIACQIFSKTEPEMNSWMNGAEITPKEKTKSKNGKKIKKYIPKEKIIGNPTNKLYVEKEAELEYPWIKSYLSSNIFTGTSGKIYIEINPNHAKSFFKFVVTKN
jgi:hypothetical protein